TALQGLAGLDERAPLLQVVGELLDEGRGLLVADLEPRGLLLGGRESGVERCIRGLAMGLDEVNHDHAIILFVPRGFDPQGWEPERVKIHRTLVPTRYRILRIPYDQILFPLVARLKGAKLIHGPGYIIPGLSRLPAVVTVYDIIALTHPHLCKKSNAAHFKKTLPRAVRRARRVIVLSEAVKRDLIEHLETPPDRIAVIPPGLDASFQILDEKEKRRVCDEYELPKKFILFTGNIEPKKNMVVLIKAFFALKMDKQIDHDLVIAGALGWKYQSVLRTAEGLEFDDHIHFLGYVPQADLPAIYNLADCFAFPSIVEGFGIPPLEAMACGTPTVTSNDPAVVEATGDAALHAPSDDVKLWRETLEKIVTDRSVHR
ncbi:MAG: glycosyltransferase family 1 protein, partial [Planctomycetota bacterium]|nr:glycosyltransferase family 1 protein [Planctomycetota bacterium]